MWDGWSAGRSAPCEDATMMRSGRKPKKVSTQRRAAARRAAAVVPASPVVFPSTSKTTLPMVAELRPFEELRGAVVREHATHQAGGRGGLDAGCAGLEAGDDVHLVSVHVHACAVFVSVTRRAQRGALRTTDWRVRKPHEATGRYGEVPGGTGRDEEVNPGLWCW